MDGYEICSWMLEHTGLYVDNFIYNQSLASDFMLKSGCYANKRSAVLQQYITRAVVGGRCMTANDEMYHVKHKVADFGAVHFNLRLCIKWRGF